MKNEIIKENDKFILEKFSKTSDVCEICGNESKELFYIHEKDNNNDVVNIILCEKCKENLTNILL